MTLQRVAIPSPNYSSLSGSKVRLIVVHTAEGALTYQALGSFFANPASGVSSHTGIDDTPNTVGEYVRRDYKAWTAANANPYSVQTELCAFAAWTPADWSAHPTMLANCAAWIAEEAATYGIPLTKLDAVSAQGGASGVCGHVDLGVAGGNHWDPGPSFPWVDVMAMAGGQAPTPPTPTPPGQAPPWPGVYLRDFTSDPSAATWQTQMSARGWTITVDGMYGPASAQICTQFQREKDLAVDGVVGPDTWTATWNAPIT
jgi:N-acetyl-anhydromuramyl-L-alanine amidase AmpD